MVPITKKKKQLARIVADESTLRGKMERQMTEQKNMLTGADQKSAFFITTASTFIYESIIVPYLI